MAWRIISTRNLHNAMPHKHKAQTKERCMTLKLAIFDLDGTLINSLPDLAFALNKTLHDFKQNTLSEDEVQALLGGGAKKLLEDAFGQNAPNIDEALNTFLLHYSDCVCKKTALYDGVESGLKRLKNAGITLALVTNKPYRFVPKILQKLQLCDLFDMVLGGDSLPTKKPDPEPLLHACRLLGFSPNEAAMIGDSKNDILAGQNAGMLSFGLNYGYNYNLPVAQFNPTQDFDTFSDLVDALLAKAK